MTGSAHATAEPLGLQHPRLRQAQDRARHFDDEFDTDSLGTTLAEVDRDPATVGDAWPRAIRPTEIAREFGISSCSVSARVGEARAELVRLALADVGG